MSSITFKMRKGEDRKFPHEGRPGGSYTKRLHYEPGFVVVENEWGTRTSIPADDIAEIIETPVRW